MSVAPQTFNSGWLGSVVFRALDLWSTGCKFSSGRICSVLCVIKTDHIWQLTTRTCETTCSGELVYRLTFDRNVFYYTIFVCVDRLMSCSSPSRLYCVISERSLQLFSSWPLTVLVSTRDNSLQNWESRHILATEIYLPSTGVSWDMGATWDIGLDWGALNSYSMQANVPSSPHVPSNHGWRY